MEESEVERFLERYSTDETFRSTVDERIRKVVENAVRSKVQDEGGPGGGFIRGAGGRHEKTGALINRTFDRRAPDVWKKHEAEVWVDDNGLCYVCKLDLLPNPSEQSAEERFRRYKSIQIDHVVPKGTRSGYPAETTAARRNLRLVCKWCNNAKAQFDPVT